MKKRYDVQVCFLDDVVNKHSVEWHSIVKTYRFRRARFHQKALESRYLRHPKSVYRIVDLRTGKPVA